MGRASGSQETQESIEEQTKETELVATQARQTCLGISPDSSGLSGAAL